MGHNINRIHVRHRSKISRAIGMLVALVLMITIAPIASAMSPVPEIDTAALTGEDGGTAVLLEDDIAERLREILYREYNWWDQGSASVNPASASEQDVDVLVAHMEQYPALYSQASNPGIETGSDGSNTLSDYRSPSSNNTTSRAIHPTMGEGFFSGVLGQGHGTAPSGDRADTLDNLSAVRTSGNDGSVITAEELQFIEQNVDFGFVILELAGPREAMSDFTFIEQNTIQSKSTAYEADSSVVSGDGLSDFQFIEQNTIHSKSTAYEADSSVASGDGLSDFQFIEQNTQLPGKDPATGDGPPHYFGGSELNY